MGVRTSDRTKHRAPCTVTIGGRRHNGFVLDLSRSGLFIQTSAQPRPGQRLDIEVVLRGETLEMHVEVVRRKAVPPQLLTVAHGGIGVRILSAPESFYAMLEQTTGPGTGGDTGARLAAKAAGGGSATTAARLAPRRPAAAPASDDEPASAAVKRPKFRVRVRQVNGTRTRTLKVDCADEVAARREVMDELGDEWKVLEIELA